MARVTIEDCLKVVPNRFELIVLVSQRTQAIISGSRPLVDRDDKEVVLALREIAEHKVDPIALYNAIVQKYTQVNKESEKYKNQASSSFFTIKDMDTEHLNMDLKTSSELEIDSSIFADQNIEVDD